ncbi:MlaD family protein [Flavobacterium terrisoli]|uniref:MlaD family protein n=1 Tax=Flavobacterium terrisoli TaxID=3242195 RepID=UPI002542D4C1|nr:MlaD family protein [Flavobacterium buctense]
MNKKTEYVWKLGMFVIIGAVLFVVSIYVIGQNRNLFSETFQLKSHFSNVSGLKVGNSVRFSGINVGTVQSIEFLSDTSVVVSVVIEEDVHKYIKSDAMASIGTDGLMGDKVLTISPGSASKVIVKNNGIIASTKAVEIEDLMQSVKVSVDNAQVITYELAEFTSKMNNENSMLSKLVNDDKMGKSLDATLANMQNATKGLNENMEAAKHNFLLKGYFNKKKKAEEKKKKELEEKEKKKKELEEKKKKEIEKKKLSEEEK